jgi:hypothetical protein
VQEPARVLMLETGGHPTEAITLTAPETATAASMGAASMVAEVTAAEVIDPRVV